MQISVNGKDKSFQAQDLSLEKVLHSENIFNSDGIAVAVNENIISNKEWKDYLIQDHDKIIIIKAVQGG